ncbi:MAG: rhodanese-like domain-containing protein [Nitrospira sp.]|nr:rhodanese-like domain-containing protein [Nitrospira sp.]MDH5252972.1 rhodanese-like domain-containing protein [Nitrospira sp.]
MRFSTVVAVGCLVAASLAVSEVAQPYHSYLLTIQQLQSGLSMARFMNKKGFILVDVRSPEEHLAGSIPGTDLNIDFRDIQSRHREIGAQLEDHIVVYCQSGRRSNIAAETLADLGYRHVYNVEGSMNAWIEAGLPVSR